MELAGEPLREHSPASLRWRCCTEKSQVLHFLPEQLIDIIHPLVVNQLAQPLYGHLSTVLVVCRHVNVINENDDPCVPHPPEQVSSLFLQLIFNCSLGIGC